MAWTSEHLLWSQEELREVLTLVSRAPNEIKLAKGNYPWQCVWRLKYAVHKKISIQSPQFLPGVLACGP